MKILFVYPTTTTNGNPDKYKKAYLPPLNLAILDRLTYVADKNHDVKIINEYVEDIDFDFEYDLVCITALTSQAVRAYQIALEFRKRKIKVIIGGVHPSLMPEEASHCADSVVIGEVENIWSTILSDAEANNLRKIYQDSDFPDLQRLVIPKWDNMNLSIYRRSLGRNMPRMPIYTTRGCVFNCNFCSVSKFFGRSYRCKPIPNVLSEIDSIPAESFFFTDDNIVCNIDYSMELFAELSSSNRKIRWFSQASTTLVNYPDLIKLAAKAGCTSLFFGVESINRKYLQASNKKFNEPRKYVELKDRCLAEGIQPLFSLIFGYDGQDYESMIKTVEFLKKNNIWNVVIWILTPLPGTDLWDEMISQKRINESSWEKYDLNHVVFTPTPLSPSQLNNNFWMAYKSLYTFPSIFLRALYSQKTSKMGFLNSLLNQYYSFQQLINKRHPYSMGIWKTN